MVRVVVSLVSGAFAYSNYQINTFRSGEVDDVSVFLEHVDLLDCLDGLDVQLLEGSLELLVVGSGRLVDSLRLTAGSTFASIIDH